MKLSLLLLTAFSASALAAAEGGIPTAHPQDRYAEMAKLCPFGLATVETPTPPPPPDPFANIVLRAVGSDFVVIQRHGDDHTIRLIGSEAREGFRVKEVNWSDVAGGSTVILVSTDTGKEGPVKFDQNLVHPTVAQQSGVPHRPVSGPQPLKVPSNAAYKVPTPPNVTKSAVPKPYMPAGLPQAAPKPSYGGQYNGKSPATGGGTGERIRIRTPQGGR